MTNDRTGPTDLTDRLLRRDMPWHAPLIWLAGLVLALPLVEALGQAVIGTSGP